MPRKFTASVQGFILLHSFCFPEDLGVSDWSVGTCSLPSRCKRFVYLVSGRLPSWLSPIHLRPVTWSFTPNFTWCPPTNSLGFWYHEMFEFHQDSFINHSTHLLPSLLLVSDRRAPLPFLSICNWHSAGNHGCCFLTLTKLTCVSHPDKLIHLGHLYWCLLARKLNRHSNLSGPDLVHMSTFGSEFNW